MNLFTGEETSGFTFSLPVAPEPRLTDSPVNLFTGKAGFVGGAPEPVLAATPAFPIPDPSGMLIPWNLPPTDFDSPMNA